MRDIDKALADIAYMRTSLAAGTMFRGLGPAVVAVTGGLALVTAVLQSLWSDVFAPSPDRFVLVWMATAVIAAGLSGAEMLARSRRHHGGLADAMIWQAVGQFLPAGVAGAAIGAVMLRYAPDTLWVLPGLWQILVGIGLLASLRCLPAGVAWIGGYYLVAGTAVLIVAATERAVSPWMMGAPFAIGQLLLAAVLYLASEDQGD